MPNGKCIFVAKCVAIWLVAMLVLVWEDILGACSIQVHYMIMEKQP